MSINVARSSAVDWQASKTPVDLKTVWIAGREQEGGGYRFPLPKFLIEKRQEYLLLRT